jgi:uncharacterized membrane protein
MTSSSPPSGFVADICIRVVLSLAFLVAMMFQWRRVFKKRHHKNPNLKPAIAARVMATICVFFMLLSGMDPYCLYFYPKWFQFQVLTFITQQAGWWAAFLSMVSYLDALGNVEALTQNEERLASVSKNKVILGILLFAQAAVSATSLADVVQLQSITSNRDLGRANTSTHPYYYAGAIGCFVSMVLFNTVCYRLHRHISDARSAAQRTRATTVSQSFALKKAKAKIIRSVIVCNLVCSFVLFLYILPPFRPMLGQEVFYPTVEESNPSDRVRTVWHMHDKPDFFLDMWKFTAGSDAEHDSVKSALTWHVYYHCIRGQAALCGALFAFALLWVSKDATGYTHTSIVSTRLRARGTTGSFLRSGRSLKTSRTQHSRNGMESGVLPFEELKSQVSFKKEQSFHVAQETPSLLPPTRKFLNETGRSMEIDEKHVIGRLVSKQEGNNMPNAEAEDEFHTAAMINTPQHFEANAEDEVEEIHILEEESDLSDGETEMNGL